MAHMEGKIITEKIYLDISYLFVQGCQSFNYDGNLGLGASLVTRDPAFERFVYADLWIVLRRCIHSSDDERGQRHG